MRLKPVELMATESHLKGLAHASSTKPLDLWGGSPDPRRSPCPALVESTHLAEADGGVGSGPARPTKSQRYHLLEADRLIQGGGIRPGDGN